MIMSSTEASLVSGQAHPNLGRISLITVTEEKGFIVTGMQSTKFHLVK